jgi:hypothetical protein
MQAAMKAIIDRNEAAGEHYFSEGTLAFFDSRINYGVYGDSVFVESTQFHFGHNTQGPECDDNCGERTYYVNRQLDDGRIERIGAYPNLDMASVHAEIEAS